MPQGALALYRRHLGSCAHFAKGNQWTRCQCPIWVQGSTGGETIRRNMNTANWTAASTSVRNRTPNRYPETPARNALQARGTDRLSAEDVEELQRRFLRQGRRGRGTPDGFDADLDIPGHKWT
jgi:hypothetical protein